MWPEAVERVAAFARAAGIDARLEEIPARGTAPEDVAAALGSHVRQLVATWLFAAGDSLVVALAPAYAHVRTSEVARLAGDPTVRPLRAGETEATTGFPFGAVPPFPLPHVATVLLDRELLAEPWLWVCAGTTTHRLMLLGYDLARVTGARVVGLSGESA
jgi:prolyl-tRNA editing enzyme YbaK/EbsC (Cys-tRNA(Pro) deacylase)